jgi:hypothetical protein
MNEQTQNIQHPDLINILLEDGLENAIPKISELLINAAMLAKDASSLTPANWLKARSGKPERMAA